MIIASRSKDTCLFQSHPSYEFKVSFNRPDPAGYLRKIVSALAIEVSRELQEEIYYTALETSCDLAEAEGPHETFAETKTAADVDVPGRSDVGYRLAIR